MLKPSEVLLVKEDVLYRNMYVQRVSQSEGMVTFQTVTVRAETGHAQTIELRVMLIAMVCRWDLMWEIYTLSFQ